MSRIHTEPFNPIHVSIILIFIINFLNLVVLPIFLPILVNTIGILFYMLCNYANNSDIDISMCMLLNNMTTQ